MPSIDLSLAIHVARGTAFQLVRDHGLSPEVMYDEGRKVYEYVLEYFGKYGKIPDPGTIENDLKFPIPPLTDAPEPPSYYLDRIKERALDKMVLEATQAQTRAMEKLNTRAAMDAVKKLLSDVNRMSLAGEPIDDWTQRTDDRWALYKEAARFKGVTGLGTPWPGISDLTMGMQPGDFWLVVGRPKSGKTWNLLKMAIYSWLTPVVTKFNDAGAVAETRPCRVLIITMEMLKRSIKERMDSIYSQLSYSGIVGGTLGMHVEDQYKISLDTLKGKNPLWVVTRNRVRDVRDIPIVIEEIQPDVVYLDGLYKMRVEGGRYKSNWEKITDIADDLDLICKTKGTIIVGTTQFNRGAVKVGNKPKGKGKTIPLAGLENLAFADALGMNPDVVIGVISTKRMKDNNEAILQLIANRRGKEGAWQVHFDPGTGNFDEIAPFDEEGGGGGDEPDDSGDGDPSVDTN